MTLMIGKSLIHPYLKESSINLEIRLSYLNISYKSSNSLFSKYQKQTEMPTLNL